MATLHYELNGNEASLLSNIASGYCPDYEEEYDAERLADDGLVDLGFDERHSVGAWSPVEATDEGLYVAAAISEFESWRGSGICVFIPDGELDAFLNLPEEARETMFNRVALRAAGIAC